jgi:hypothetical protein
MVPLGKVKLTVAETGVLLTSASPVGELGKALVVTVIEGDMTEVPVEFVAVITKL